MYVLTLNGIKVYTSYRLELWTRFISSLSKSLDHIPGLFYNTYLIKKNETFTFIVHLIQPYSISTTNGLSMVFHFI